MTNPNIRHDLHAFSHLFSQRQMSASHDVTSSRQTHTFSSLLLLTVVHGTVHLPRWLLTPTTETLCCPMLADKQPLHLCPCLALAEDTIAKWAGVGMLPSWHHTEPRKSAALDICVPAFASSVSPLSSHKERTDRLDAGCRISMGLAQTQFGTICASEDNNANCPTRSLLLRQQPF